MSINIDFLLMTPTAKQREWLFHRKLDFYGITPTEEEADRFVKETQGFTGIACEDVIRDMLYEKAKGE